MPGRRVPEKPTDESLCRRCQIEAPAITIRTEPLCKDCFSKYAQTKVVKRMESFRVRNSSAEKGRRLLLPIDFDASPLGLLHILSQHLKGQTEKTGRTGFSLCIVHVCHGNVPEAEESDAALTQIKNIYPEHEYHSAALSQVLLSEDITNLFPDILGTAEGQSSLEEQFAQLLKSLNSATARQDTLQILKQRLTVRLARDKDCEAIIWPDSTTRLAERTLAETAKGRGFALPWIVADGESVYGLPFYFPMRELLTREIEAYVAFLDPPLPAGIIKNDSKPAVSTKNTTIDDLMTQYFESVEKEYPSIVANVVRTTGKLQAPLLSQVEQQCELCSLPLESSAPARSRLCYGCIRNIQRPAANS